MPLFIQYDPAGDGYFSTVRCVTAPQCPADMAQIEAPEDTDINCKILDLSRSPPALADMPEEVG